VEGLGFNKKGKKRNKEIKKGLLDASTKIDGNNN
jgi:hypothetical protein